MFINRRDTQLFSSKLHDENRLFRSLQPEHSQQQKSHKTPISICRKRKGDNIQFNRNQPKELFLRTIDIDLLEPWGKTDYIGITGLEVILENGSALPLDILKDTFSENASIAKNSRGLRFCHVLFPYTALGRRRIHVMI